MKRRVLLTCQSSTVGGVERRLLDEVAVLQSLGMEVWLAPSKFSGDATWLAQMEALGVKRFDWQPYKFIERQHTMFPFPTLGWWGRRRLKQMGFSLAHVALPWTRVGFSRIHDLVVAGVPVVLGLHCSYPKESWSARLDPYIKRALDGVQSAYAVSAPVKQGFLANFAHLRPDLDIEVIHNGIDTSRFVADLDSRLAIRAGWGFSEHDEVLVVCGRLDDFKRPWISLRAFAQARKSRSHLRLVFIGDGPARMALEREASDLGVLSDVRFTGFVKDTASLLAASDLMLTTSLGEGFSLAPAEALSCGLSVMLTDEPAQRAAYGECPTARLVDSSDPLIWSECIVAWAEKGPAERAQQSLVSRAFATACLDKQLMLRALKAFYRTQSQVQV